jgi:DNA polymerase-3 subunit alpha
MRDDIAGAIESAKVHEEIFGKDNFYLEIMNNGYEAQCGVTPKMRKVAEETGIRLAITQDIHYIEPQDSKAQDILICIGTGRTVGDEKRFRMDDLELYFRTRQQMLDLFPNDREALEVTGEIADRCDVELDFDTYHLPVFKPETGETPDEMFDRLCDEGARRHYGEITPKVRERLEYEKGIIKQLGFVSYFLITADFIRFAIDNGIPVGPGRGSAAGSIVAYCLDITMLDPLKYDLLFERFLNAERISMPDIDIDFCRDKRELVIEYVRDKYGVENVSQIITFGTMASRGVIRDVGRAMEVPLAEVDKIAKKVPNGPGASLRKAIETDSELQEVRKANEMNEALFDIGVRLEGFCRHASTHAAGVVLADKPLDELVPLYRNGDDITTQWQMTDLEDVGMLKMDFLGLKTLTILEEAETMVREQHGVTIDWAEIGLEDPATYDLLQRGDTLGVFQLESEGMRELLARLKPDCFEDIIAVLALYRPGPLQSGMVDMYVKRKHGEQKVDYPHESLEKILKDTYGVIVYQEQVMLTAHEMAGFTLNQADKLRKAMGKKKPEVMHEFRKLFVDGAVEKGHKAKLADEVFTTMEFFAGYGFNKSHSAAYALLTYRTAYLKANYPTEFLCGLLTCDMGLTDKVKEFSGEAVRLGIPVLPPDVNKSRSKFTVEHVHKDGKDVSCIRYGLGAIKGLGLKACDALVAEREKKGEYSDLPNLTERWDPKLANKSCYESLIKAGAIDFSGWSRRSMNEAVEDLLREAAAVHKDRAKGQNLLFAAPVADDGKHEKRPIPDTPEWEEAERLLLEKEALGFYLSGHPFEKRGPFYARLARMDTKLLAKVAESGQPQPDMVLPGMITAARSLIVKNGKNAGKRMAKFRLEDLEGSVGCTVFTGKYEDVKQFIIDDEIVFVACRLDKNSDDLAVLVDDIVPAERYVRQNVDAFVLVLDPLRHDRAQLETARDLMRKYPGGHRVIFDVPGPDGSRYSLLADPEFQVNIDDALIDELGDLLGADALSFTRK